MDSVLLLLLGLYCGTAGSSAVSTKVLPQCSDRFSPPLCLVSSYDVLRLRGGVAPRLRSVDATSVSGRGEGKTPDFELTTWRINASRAPGAWPGPATTFLIPTEEEFAEFGNGKIYPGVGTENVTLEEFVRSFHTGTTGRSVSPPLGQQLSIVTPTVAPNDCGLLIL